MKRFPSLAHSYDSEKWELWVCLAGEREYVFKDISPFHNRRFVSLCRLSRGKAWQFLMQFSHTRSYQWTTPKQNSKLTQACLFDLKASGVPQAAR